MQSSARRGFLRKVATGIVSLGVPRLLRSEPLVPDDVNAGSAIPIDVGRQLFVDDFLIGECNLKRAIHPAILHESNPVLSPQTPMEMNGGSRPVACPFDDGVVFDPRDSQYKMWYHAGWFDGTAYATSRDGLHWQRPNLDVEPGTNRVLPAQAAYHRDGATVWLDHAVQDPAERFKMFVYFRTKDWEGGQVYTSHDGIHWSLRGKTGPCGDNTCFYYDPFRKNWVYSIRTYNQGVRTRGYWAHADFVRGANWKKEDLVEWLQADPLDQPDPALGYPPQLYKFSAVAYESLMIGLFAIFKGPPNEIASKQGIPKTIDLTVGFSRDGFHWNRLDYKPFLACSRVPGSWNRGYLHSSAGICLVVGEKLHFYFGAFSGVSPRVGGDLYAGASTGLATLRRDGFASLDAGNKPGSVTTRSVTFNGRNLFVNVDAKLGEFRAELLDEHNDVIPPFSAENCVPLCADCTRVAVIWKHGRDLSSFAGHTVKLRFHLTNASLYSFWISPDLSGASNGYLAAGGPGLTGATDTTGDQKLVLHPQRT